MNEPALVLGDSDRARFSREGYLVLRGVVPPGQVAAARHEIARGVAADQRIGQLTRFLASTFLPELTSHPAIVSLYEPLRAHTAALFGLAQAPDVSRAQIALRFPERAPSDEHFGVHIDGFPTADNPVTRGTIHRNTLLVGVYLTTLSGPDRGNFVVWPRSHRHVAELMRELDAPRVLSERGAEVVLAEVMRRARAGIAPLAGPSSALQVEAEPGDAVLAHGLLAHGAAPNVSLHVREAIYFRVLHPEDRADDPAPLLDPQRFFARSA